MLKINLNMKTAVEKKIKRYKFNILTTLKDNTLIKTILEGKNEGRQARIRL